ncbi:aspartyl/asparaginyl beta-hydroxylase domain-containing protein [Candidatus Pelagibacter bacterium]|nr:aspartyl/asparaginyl beta-hydroxylase domain-containing protein [Candidatus Pelagibacter bacterium]MDA9624776.1 aspartyl/asparaginyl beta-hydroxylase domain-containing protein [Candidatus Pelagibacter bacterium]
MDNIEYNDFYKVPNIKFDISKLRTDLENILTKKKFNSLGIKNFGAISLNQIPGDKESIEGHNVRGTYWTLPDETGKEAVRDIPIDESKYTQLVSDFHNTYFEEVYNTLRKKFKLGRVRILLKEPRSTLSWHRDPEPRLHIPIVTNPGCRMVIDNIAKHMPADGTVTITNNTKYHNFFNGGEQERIHLVACVLEDPFKNHGN